MQSVKKLPLFIVLFILSPIIIGAFSNKVYAILFIGDGVLSPSDDAYITHINPTANFGSSQTMWVGETFPPNATDNVYAQQHLALVKFDLSRYSRDTVIQSATLKLNRAATIGQIPNDIHVIKATRGTWEEESVTWDTSLARSYNPEIQPLGVTADGVYSWNVKPIVEQWLRGEYPNQGFYIEARPVRSGEGRAFRTYHIDFKTKEAGVSDAPKLYLSIASPTPTPTPAPINIPRINTGGKFFDGIKVIFPTDSNGPSISNIRTAVNLNSVTIYWDTDKDATSQVAYSIDDRLDQLSNLNSTLTKNHSITINNLEQGNYNYTVISKDTNNKQTISGVNHFTVVATNYPDVDQAEEDELNDDQNNEQDESKNQNSKNTMNAQDDSNSGFLDNVRDGIAKTLVSSRLKSGENEDPNTLKSINPLVLISGAYGINRTVGIVLIVTSLLLFLLAFLILHAGKKTYHHVKKRINKDKENHNTENNVEKEQDEGRKRE